jgi:hypothetical protein
LKLGGFTWELDPEVPLDVPYIRLKSMVQYMQYSMGSGGGLG